MTIPEATARAIRLVVLDVDGVLTDGGTYVGQISGGETFEMKRYNIQDGLGVKMLMWAGIKVAVVSGRVSSSTELRAKELGIQEIHMDAGANKVPIVAGIMASQEGTPLTWDEVCHIGDDLADLPVLRRVGLPATVANGVPEVRHMAVWQSVKSGGDGAVRELAEALLKARGEWEALVESYCEQRNG